VSKRIVGAGASGKKEAEKEANQCPCCLSFYKLGKPSCMCVLEVSDSRNVSRRRRRKKHDTK